jgi:hypothetical protein
MTEELPDDNKPKMQLIVALAQGFSVAAWARGAGVPLRTAYRWASQRNVRSAVAACRRRALDQAVGVMTNNATWAAGQIVKLGESASSESIKLSALRAVLNQTITVSKFAGLEERLAEVEEKLDERDGTSIANCPG